MDGWWLEACNTHDKQYALSIRKSGLNWFAYKFKSDFKLGINVAKSGLKHWYKLGVMVTVPMGITMWLGVSIFGWYSYINIKKEKLC